MTTKKTIDYDQIASTYAQNRDASPQVVAHILQHAGVYKEVNHAILEIGCGTANYLYALSKCWGSRGYGFDDSSEMIREARQKYQGLDLQVGNANNRFPYLSGEFKFAFSIDVIHYINDLEHYYTEALRVIDKNGLLVTITDSSEDLGNRTISKYFPETIERELERYHTIPTLEAVMKKVGFHDVHVTHIQQPWRIGPDYIEKVKRKAFSALRLISENDFQAGLKRIIDDQYSGKAIGYEVNTFVWGRKPEY